MLQKIIEFSVKQKLIIGILVFFLIVIGIWQLTKLSIDAVPDITNNQVQIITTAPSLGATDIERLVTFPVEQANSNIPGLIELRSFSRFGLSLVTLVFDESTDVYWARQQVAERLQNVNALIPPGAGMPVLAPITTGLGEIYQYTLRADKGYESVYDITELRTLQDWIVRRELLRVNGIADVSSFGGYLKQYEIAIRPDVLLAKGLSVDDVFQALEKNNQNTGGAYIEKEEGILFIRSEGLIGSKEDLEWISVRNGEDGLPLYLKDVAEIRTGHAIRYGAMTRNGEGEVAGAVVMMVKGGNSSQVIKEVKDKVHEIQKMLPKGVIIESFLDRTKMVNNSIQTVKTNLLEGALIVVFVLVFFLGNIRAGLLVASVIPLSMLFAVILMNIFGVSGNLMSLGALDFGLIVDGAVIIVEAILYHLHFGMGTRKGIRLEQTEMNQIVQNSAGKMMNSAVFGQIIILIVYLPILSLQGIEGKMFTPMAQTVAFALMGAGILSLTYIPMMSSLLLSKNTNTHAGFSDKIIGVIENRYSTLLKKTLRMPGKIMAGVAVLFFMALFLGSRLGGEFIPALEEGDFAVETRVLTGSSLSLSTDVCLKAEKILLEKFPEVIQVVGKTGSSEIPVDPMPVEASDLIVVLKDKSEWTSAKTFNELAEKMKAELSVLPGVTFGFQYPVQMRFNELMTGARQDVVCKVFGENLDSLTRYAHSLGEIISGIEGTADVYIESVTGMPQIVITYNRRALAEYGVSIEDVNRTVNAAFSGQSAGLVYEGEKRFDLVVRMRDDIRNNSEAVYNLLIPVHSGIQVPLYLLADVKITEGPNQIQREDAKRRIAVGFNVRGRDVQSIMQELKQKIKSDLRFSPGYSVTYGGSFKNLEDAKQRLMIAVPVALILIFLLLYFAFHSVSQGLLIFSAIPLSAIGGIIGLYIRGLPFSISAGIGFIALFGVAVLNGIVLLAEFNRIRKQGVTDVYKIVLQGTRMRMRPVLMTAFVASLGFLPMALSHGAGAEVQRPLATVVIFGLLLATFLTLFVLPALYIMLEKGMFRISFFARRASVFLVCGISFISTEAQIPITLEQVWKTGEENNFQIRNAKLETEYRNKLVQSGNTISPTSLQTEFGQINSIYTDWRFGISQSFELPQVYSRNKLFLQQSAEQAASGLILNRAEFKKISTEIFVNLYFTQKKAAVIVSADSILQQVKNMTQKKFRAGEINILEKSAMDNQGLMWQNYLQQNNSDQMNFQNQLQQILHSEVIFKPIFPAEKLWVPDSVFTNFDQHPALKISEWEKIKAGTQMKILKSRFLPGFNIGVYSMSMYGNGADNRFYAHGQRFQSVQAGISIPLLGGANRSLYAASLIQIEKSRNQYAADKFRMTHEYELLRNKLISEKNIILRFEHEIIPNIQIIMRSLQQKLNAGEINYSEWAYLMNQNVSLQLEYLDALTRYNITCAQLNYFVQL